ncbi:MAG: 1-acyl-sn-glycerol-3-phosphate acyltransferase [Candidatus Saccharimonadales bacterium]
MFEKKSTWPDINLANHQEVYKYFGSEPYVTQYDGKPRIISQATREVVECLYEPRIDYSVETRQALQTMVETEASALILVNHTSNHDPLLVSSAIRKEPSLATVIDRSGLRIIAKDGMFRWFMMSRFCEAYQLVPAFRPVDYPGDSKENRLNLAHAAHGSVDTSVGYLKHGDGVLIFPEGKCNEHRTRVLQIGSSAAKIVLDAQKTGVDNLNIICMGVSRGPRNRARSANVHIDCYPAAELPNRLPQVVSFMQKGMQSAVDQAGLSYFSGSRQAGTYTEARWLYLLGKLGVNPPEQLAA